MGAGRPQPFEPRLSASRANHIGPYPLAAGISRPGAGDHAASRRRNDRNRPPRETLQGVAVGIRGVLLERRNSAFRRARRQDHPGVSQACPRLPPDDRSGGQGRRHHRARRHQGWAEIAAEFGRENAQRSIWSANRFQHPARRRPGGGRAV